uniref:Uncharacterized protein n=1 Tax=Panagrolaimus davidi TaxID=227884 RepID=A0A914PZM3_9BILA
MQASPGSTSNQSNIIRAPNYRLGIERWIKHLYIFDSDHKTLCYNYTFKKQKNSMNYFVCFKCKHLNKSTVSARIVSNENGEEYVKLSENEHVCQRQKYKPPTIIYEPDFKLNTVEYGGKKDQRLHVFDSNDKTLYYIYTWISHTETYRCDSCVYNHDINVRAFLTNDESGNKCCVLNDQKHQCKPQKLKS